MMSLRKRVICGRIAPVNAERRSPTRCAYDLLVPRRVGARRSENYVFTD
jgi:hypothetical protein